VQRRDAASGLVAVLVGAVTYAYTLLTFPVMPDGHPGPALFPRLVSALLVTFGALLIWQARRPSAAGAVADAEIVPQVEAPQRGRRLDLVLVVGAVVAFVTLLEPVGFPLLVGVIVLVLVKRLGSGWAAAAGTALVMGVGAYLLFARVLLVPLPLGLLEPLRRLLG
jgi:putative tricarboxylic transport membrane protein